LSDSNEILAGWRSAAAADRRPARWGILARSSIGSALVAAVFWTIVGLVFFLPSLAMGGGRDQLLSSLAQWWSWGLITPVIFAVDRRLPIAETQFARRALALVAGCLVFTPIYLWLFFAVRALLRLGPWSALEPAQMFNLRQLAGYMWSGVVYMVIVGGIQAWRYSTRYAASELRLERIERSYSEARLNALRMQLDPHFLFNALNTISSHVERDPRLTRRMIEHLGDLLRISLESKDRQEIPLAEEIDFLDHYLAIQKIRFGDQLRLHIEIAPEVRAASVPSLILQPLVENAIRHGISRRASGGSVSVIAAAVDGRLQILVLDDGLGLPEGWSLENSSGLGLSVTRERIAVLYPNGESRFTVQRRTEGGTEVEILLPLHPAGRRDADTSA
jgi:two-component system, LytTR family, sensor kinase